MDAPAWTLLADASLSLIAAGVYLFVARVVHTRQTADEEARRALLAFESWWIGLAAVTGLAALRSGLAAFGILQLELHVALTYLTLAPLVVLLWGLLYYLLYVHTGNPRFYAPLAIAHVGIFAYILYVLVHLRPIGVERTVWTVTLSYARELDGFALYALFGLIVGPILLAALAYATLAFRTRDPTARFRSAIVSGAILLWFGSAAIAAVLGASAELTWWPLAARGIGLGATGIILLAFCPPPRLARALGIRGFARAGKDDRPREGPAGGPGSGATP